MKILQFFQKRIQPQCDPHGAGNTYDLTPSGLVSNYSFNYQNEFSLFLKSLVVLVANENSIYGDSVTYTLNSVSYYDSGSGTQTVRA